MFSYPIAPSPLNYLDLTFHAFFSLQLGLGPVILFPLILLHFFFLAEDEEDTIAAEEQLEGEVDHAMELSELAREGDIHQTFTEHPLAVFSVQNARDKEMNKILFIPLGGTPGLMTKTDVNK